MCIDGSRLCFNASSTHLFPLYMQFHIRVLESTPEFVTLLLAGLEYLINISYVDDTEVFKVCKLLLLILLILKQLYILFSPY